MAKIRPKGQTQFGTQGQLFEQVDGQERPTASALGAANTPVAKYELTDRLHANLFGGPRGR